MVTNLFFSPGSHPVDLSLNGLQTISTTVALVVEVVLPMFLVPMLTLATESWQAVSKL
tara:strand:+ start:43 stop:216 length:174 start_codon:yes stop_codon:yes gene_type:complete